MHLAFLYFGYLCDFQFCWFPYINIAAINILDFVCTSDYFLKINVPGLQYNVY